MLAVKPVGRHGPVDAGLVNVPSRFGNVLWIDVQSLHHVPIIGSELCRQLAVAATDVNDDPALDTR